MDAAVHPDRQRLSLHIRDKIRDDYFVEGNQEGEQRSDKDGWSQKGQRHATKYRPLASPHYCCSHLEIAVDVSETSQRGNDDKRDRYNGMAHDKSKGRSRQPRAAEVQIQPKRDDDHGNEDRREQKDGQKLLAGELRSCERIRCPDS